MFCISDYNFFLCVFLSAFLRNFSLRQDRLRGVALGRALIYTNNTNPEQQAHCSKILINNNGYDTMPQAGIDPPAQSHASYGASARPSSHHGWIITRVIRNTNFIWSKKRQSTRTAHIKKTYQRLK